MTIREILEVYKHVAVIGVSEKRGKPSRNVTKYLIHAGYTIYPVNPNLNSVFGITCYPSLLEIPSEKRNLIEIVDIFRKSEDVEPIVDQAIEIGAKVIWMQLGITNDAASRKAEQAGLEVIQNRCIAVEHSLLAGR
ncbi:CoA-binding protein [Prosthecochloris sp. SCSIO W1102]|uniref:CoA-binding protein n=1 Tax=Prosthecochloris sp. SCSIO W1102 TaxID=2992243 RepID=UPI00223D77D8|nr:CoA-binding protein [Prosthecochloris sp. SCSIO W1102]UZJ39605.1 CoA-binding protein [Prosthecochloris sp. SCSIO W1102]